MRCTSPLLHLLALIPFTTAHDLVPNSVPEPSTRAPQTPSSTVKILVCGDSISQGSDFDFTWRYRLWEWFQSNTAAQLAPTLQFIGPYIGTFPTDLYHDGQNEPGRVPDWGAYHPSVDPAFDGAHFSLSSRPAWQAVGMVPVVVQAYQPDLVVLQLGFNDIAWWSAGPKGLVELMEQLVAGVRMGRPDVGVLVADVTSRTFMEGKGEIERMTRGYNALLALKIKEWSTPESPVTLVKVHDEYDCHLEDCPAGVDGLHPNALGEYQIARAYTKVLHEQYHFGSGPLAVPPVGTIPGMEYLHGSKFSTLLIMLASVSSLVMLVALLRYQQRETGRTTEKYQQLPTAI